MGFSSNGMKSVKGNRRLLKKRSFLRNNLYKIKGSVIGKKSKRKYQSFFDRLAILILNKMGYSNVV